MVEDKPLIRGGGLSRVESDVKLTFDDVLLIPNMSDIETRETIDTSVSFLGLDLKIPIVSANMDYVTGAQMANAMFRNGGLGILHRFHRSPEEEDAEIGSLDYPAFISVGIRNGPQEVLDKIATYSPYGVCIDVAHGHHSNVLDLIEEIKKAFPKVYVIAGNVVTKWGYFALAGVGADAVKIGIGPGSTCTTREVTGVGYPQFSAILEIAAVKSSGVPVIADGGIKNSGDIVKALAAGADMVMLGSLLAGSEECPGERRVDSYNRRWRPFRGQSSFGTNGEKFVPEGISGWVEEKGPVSEVLRKLVAGIKSGMSYVGATTLQELVEYAYFVKVSPTTQIESSIRVRLDMEDRP